MYEYIKKSEVLNYLVGKKRLYDRCAEIAQSTNRTTMMLNEEDSHVMGETIEKVAGMETMTINGQTSDGYHTFDELYHHRAVLFSVIVSMFPQLSWKSRKHSNEETDPMYEGMFIVGIDTPKGQATYHYDMEKYWNLFKCKELDNAPEYDGHTSDEAIQRIGSLWNYKDMPVRKKENNQNGGGYEKVQGNH